MTGKMVWKSSLGEAAPLSKMSCGDIDPRGVTGTPVIDPNTNSIYVAGIVTDPAGAPQQKIFALSVENGAMRPGWPVDVSSAMAAQGLGFNSRTENQRGALVVLKDVVYVPYGSTWDCGSYRGWVVGVKLTQPNAVSNWRTAGLGGGIWSPGGIASDGASLFVATGDGHNPDGSQYDGDVWRNSEAVLRLNPVPAFSGNPKDFFSPGDWRTLDKHDADLSGSSPVLFDMDSSKLAIQLSKSNTAYLLNRDDLGGFGGSLAEKQVSSRGMITTPSVYTDGQAAMVAFQGPGANCPNTGARPELTMLKVKLDEPSSIQTAWCASLSGNLPARQLGATVVTTTDGHSNPIVWVLGAEDDDRLYGFRGDTGESLFVSAPMSGLHRFQALIASQDRLYIAGDGNVFAYKWASDQQPSVSATITTPSER
jgi:hypothetical protein